MRSGNTASGIRDGIMANGLQATPTTTPWPRRSTHCSRPNCPQQGTLEGHRRPEIAVAEYIDWFNHRRLHGEIGLIPPAEYEDKHYRHNTPRPPSTCQFRVSTQPGTGQTARRTYAGPTGMPSSSLPRPTTVVLPYGRRR